MNESFGYLATLSGTPAEQAWLQERLETLSEWERLVLTAEKTRRQSKRSALWKAAWSFPPLPDMRS